jgi:RNA polymerase sigma-70 factor (sigma-E family)
MGAPSRRSIPRLSTPVVSIRLSKIDLCGGCDLPPLVMAGAEADKGIDPLKRVRGMEQGLEFAEFYESTRDDCLRIVLLNVGDRHLAHDLVAEAYTRAWMSWRKVRELEVPRAWVVRTALNTHVSWWRRRRHEVALDNHDIAMPAEQATAVSGDLLGELRRLPARQREVVTLRLLLDLDTATTARVLGIAPGTVSAHLHKAVATLRAAIPSHDSQEISK